MNGRMLKPDELAEHTNTIMYRRWDGQKWTDPLDILAVPDDSLAEYVSATIDSRNQLHLVWTGLTQIYYSTAPAAEAYSPRAWSEPEVISTDSARTKFESDVAVDSQGNVHVVYASRGSAAGVFHVMKGPNSDAWTEPTRISDALRDNETALADVRLVIDASDRLHADMEHH